MDRLTEDDLIAAHFAPWAGEGAFALTDDAAALRPRPDHDIVVTVDAIVEGVHFLHGDPPASVAIKALGVNLSDLAAKGARPKAFVLTLMRPPGLSDAWLIAFAAALKGAARQYGCALIGGDTTRTDGPLALSITAFGELPGGAIVRRMGARIGDIIAVTGTIGDAALGLHLRRDGALPGGLLLGETARAALVDRYLYPQPRTPLAPVIREYATASMDVSDGLVGDLAKLLRVSGIGGQMGIDDVPLSAAAREALRLDPALRETALTGGDDYEILCTVPLDAWRAASHDAAAVQVPLTRIGHVMGGGELVLHDANGRIVSYARASFSHF